MQVNCSASAAACVWLNQTPMYMFFHPFDGVKKWLMGGNQNVIAHELGHTMGMADQYEYGRNNSHEVYHTPDKQRTTMDSAKPFARFGCDDVDGFINLLDVGVFGNRRGGKEGWRSFCKGRNYSYVNGRPVVNAKYAVDLLSNVVVGPVLHIYDKQGQQIKRKQYIFAPSDAPYDLTIPFHPLQTEKDRLGRVVYQKNARGEERFCSYTYERTSCMAVKGDKLLFSYVQILNKKTACLKSAILMAGIFLPPLLPLNKRAIQNRWCFPLETTIKCIMFLPMGISPRLKVWACSNRSFMPYLLWMRPSIANQTTEKTKQCNPMCKRFLICI